jgi:hypothetical protein
MGTLSWVEMVARGLPLCLAAWLLLLLAAAPCAHAQSKGVPPLSDGLKKDRECRLEASCSLSNACSVVYAGCFPLARGDPRQCTSRCSIPRDQIAGQISCGQTYEQNILLLLVAAVQALMALQTSITAVGSSKIATWKSTGTLVWGLLFS